MHWPLSNCLAALSDADFARIRLLSMLAVLLSGLFIGCVAAKRLSAPQRSAKKIMTLVLVVFNWLIALLVIWRMQLTSELIWVPIIGLCLMLTITASSTAISSLLKLDSKTRLTLILAASLSNLGYTGGAFVCYALFGMTGLALANIYIVFWVPAAYLIFFPLLKIREVRTRGRSIKFTLNDVLDLRCLALPAIITAIILNLTGVKFPAFIARLHIIDIFVYIASALSFFAIGLSINLSRLKNYMSLYFLVAAVKFILTPAAAVLLIWLLALTGQNLSPLVQKVIIVLAMTPSAVLMVTMSNVFDLDGPLAATLWLTTTATFALIIVPVLFFVFA